MKRFGIWLWPREVLEQGAETVLARCGSLGVTDVFLLVKGLAGRVCYHRTKLSLPVVSPDRDILEESLCAAHSRGIRLHAWFTSAHDALYKAQHPEAGNLNFLHGRNNSAIRMADPGYRGYMASLCAELFATYAVDGLHLDYIRFGHLLSGWAEEDLQALRARGADTARLDALMRETFVGDAKDERRIFDAYRAGDKDVLALAGYRRDTVKDFARLLIDAARAYRPGLTVTAALMPEGAYPDIAFSDLHYGQNYADAAGLYDYVLPMAYHVEYGKTPDWAVDIARGAIQRGNRVVAGVQAYGKGTADEAAACIEALRSARDPQLEGACLFRYGEPACDGLLR